MCTCVCVRAHTHTHYDTQVEVKGQLGEVSTFLPPWGFWGLKSCLGLVVSLYPSSYFADLGFFFFKYGKICNIHEK